MSEKLKKESDIMTSTPNPNSNEDNSSIFSQLLYFQTSFTAQNDKDINNISNLVNFFAQISDGIDSLYQSLSSYNITLEDSEKYCINFLLAEFYTHNFKIFDKFIKVSEKIKSELIPSFKKIKKVYERESKKFILQLKDIIDQISLHQDVLNNIKKEYYDETEKLELMEKNKQKDINQSQNNNNEIMQKMSSQTKLIEIKFSLYKKEVEVMKKLYSDCEKDFNSLKQKMKENEIKKNNAVYLGVANYYKILNSDMKLVDIDNMAGEQRVGRYKRFFDNNSEITNELLKTIPDLNTNWKYDFNISSSNKEANEADTSLNKEIKDNDKSQEKENSSKPIKFEEMIIMPNNIYEIKGINVNYMELDKDIFEKVKLDEDGNTQKFENELSNSLDFFKIICSKNIIQGEQKNNIMNILEKNKGNINCYINFCDKFLDVNESKSQEILEFQSYTNFAYFSNLLKNIIENISEDLLSNNIISYLLFDKIICLGEKCVYEDTYMCGLLSSENSIFQKEIIWKNSIKNKLINLFDAICQNEASKDKEDPYYLKITFGNFGKIMKAVGTMIKEKDKNNLIEYYELNNNIKSYKKLSSSKIKYINNNYGQIFLHELIKCYIRHMINYNFLNLNNNQNLVQDIITKILNDFDINNNNNNRFFNLYFSSNIYCAKKPSISKKEKLRKNILNPINNYEKDKFNIFLIKKASKYLDIKSKINLMNLSKKYKSINKYIFKKILKNDTEFNSNKRIHIWKIILNYNQSLKKYNYKKLLEEVNKVPLNEKEGTDFIIMVDIKRTKFKEKENNGQNILCNLLRCIVHNNKGSNQNDDDSITYCQGMNFIAALFFDIVQKEEETFHLLKCFFTNGKFETIFKNRLSKLKDYFTIFEKMIYLFLPKIYNKFIANHIQVNVFACPYFITIFTNIYYYQEDKSIKFLLNSLDDFILNGWCSVFSTFISILKHFEKKILSLNGEDLIKFLVNDMGKSDLFTDDNFSVFYKLKKQNWISNELLECLEEEIKLEKGIKSELKAN